MHVIKLFRGFAGLSSDGRVAKASSLDLSLELPMVVEFLIRQSALHK